MTRVNSPAESHLATDRDTVRTWLTDHDLVPVRDANASDPDAEYVLVPRDELNSSQEEADWDAFFEHLDAHDLLVLYVPEREREGFEIVRRDEAAQRTNLEVSEVEERLLEGETVTTQFTETTVVEEVVVEEATIESRVVETELLDERIVDAELVGREVSNCQVVSDESTSTDRAEDRSEVDRFLSSHDGSQRDLDEASFADLGYHAEFDVDDEWRVTRELLEQLTVESKVTDVDVGETAEVTSSDLETSIDVGAIQEELLASDLVDVHAPEDVETGHIESEFHEGDAVRTVLTRRQRVEDTVHETRHFVAEPTGGTIERFETTKSRILERGLAEEGGFADSDEVTMGEVRRTPTDDDAGKQVVDADGHRIGIVVEVSDDMANVDPHPGITQKISSKLGWSHADEDDITVGSSRIERITHDRVILRAGEEPED